MNNRYLSKYSKYDTHFNRRDAWQHIAWADNEPKTPIWLRVFAGLGLLLSFIVLFFI